MRFSHITMEQSKSEHSTFVTEEKASVIDISSGIDLPRNKQREKEKHVDWIELNFRRILLIKA